MPQQEEQLLEHVKVLATADGRAMGTAGHSRARKYICAILKHLKLKPYIDESFEIIQRTSTEELINVVAVAPGRDPDRKPILVGAHYDTFGSLPGADDNAAAVSIVLEIGRSLAYLPAACDVVLALFDNEEFGYLARASMGSTRFYEDVCERPVRCAFIMDLVGHDAVVPNLEQLMFVNGMESSPTWAALLRNTEPSEGLSWATFLNSYVGSLSDHFVFEKNNDPYLFFSCGRWEHYHQSTDTFDKLNYSKMAIFKDALLSLIRATAEDEPLIESYDSTNDELYFLRKNVLPGLGMTDDSLTTREDINQLVSKILSDFNL